jgi:hypothetical protein
MKNGPYLKENVKLGGRLLQEIARASSRVSMLPYFSSGLHEKFTRQKSTKSRSGVQPFKANLSGPS